jgi:hypothetical protein
MLDKKIRIFSVFIFFGIAALFFPATAFSNAVANAQQEEVYSLDYQEEEARDGYYYNNDNYYGEEEENNNYYTYNKDNIKKDPIVKIKKKLFVCENALNPEPSFPSGEEFRCMVPTPLTDLPARPDSGQYIPCTEELCPGIDESDFAVQIFKDVATVRDLTPEGIKVNLDKFHYTVAESDISKNIDFDSDSTFFPNFPIPVRGPIPTSFCFPSGFAHSLQYAIATENVGILYDICVNYVGDCEGIIYAGEVKTCTVENYIYFGFNSNEPPCIRDCATTGTPTTQSNNTEGEIPNTALSVPLDSLS